MRLAILIAGLIVSLGAQSQEIYKWVDKDGVVHYADQPGAPDAQRVMVPGAERRPAEEPVDEPSGAALPARQPEQQAEAPYGTLAILTPAQDEMFYGANVSIPVMVESDADLRPGDQLLVFLDGNRVPDVQGMEVTLNGVNRGSHFLRAAIVDGNGNALINSPQLTFHVRAPSIASPPTGPAVNLPQPGSPNRPRPTPLPANRGT